MSEWDDVINIHKVAMCLWCGRLLEVCLKDCCFDKVIGGTARVIHKELPAPKEDDK